jgi:acyl-CoA dehydrogenase
MDFSLSQDEIAIREAVARICASFDDDYWRECDASARFPEAFRDALIEGGWLGIAMPEEFGGSGLGITEAAIMMHTIARSAGAMSAASTVHINIFGPHPIVVFGNDEQKRRWLPDVIAGRTTVCFGVTEPDAGLDTTRIRTAARRDGDDYVIDGRKWFITGALDPRCRICIFLGVTDPEAGPHARHSMVLVPMDTPGVEVVRNLPIMHHVAPEGHCEMLFRSVRVPRANLLGEEGKGFALAQARLGPGRNHHCMRSIGQCELALELMCARAREREAFGRKLHDHGTVAEWIALSRQEIDQARLLVLRAAWRIDREGNRAARDDVSMIKVVVARLQTTVLERAMQVFGAMGLTPDTPLAFLWTWGRALRFVDGPDEVHLRAIARREMRRQEANTIRVADHLVPPGRSGRH